LITNQKTVIIFASNLHGGRMSENNSTATHYIGERLETRDYYRFDEGQKKWQHSKSPEGPWRNTMVNPTKHTHCKPYTG
jgi:hypothetical protein